MPGLPVDILDVKDFLRLPDFKPPFEFIGGRVVQKFAKDLPRSLIKTELMMAMNAFARPRKLGWVYSSLRVILGGSVLVPEVSFFGAGRLPKYVPGEEITTPPEIALEFLAPGQSIAEGRRKLCLVINHGGQIGWLINQARQQIHVIRPGKTSQLLKAGDRLSGEEVLPGFSLSLEEIFGWLDQD